MMVQLQTQARSEFIGVEDVTPLFAEHMPGKYRKLQGTLPLPSGEQEIIVYRVAGENQWQEIGRSSIQVLTSTGLERLDVTPRLTLANKSQWKEGSSGDAIPSERERFHDLTMDAGIDLSGAYQDDEFNISASFVGASYQPETLRFLQKGNDAPKLDLAEYLATYKAAINKLDIYKFRVGGVRADMMSGALRRSQGSCDFVPERDYNRQAAQKTGAKTFELTIVGHITGSSSQSTCYLYLSIQSKDKNGSVLDNVNISVSIPVKPPQPRQTIKVVNTYQLLPYFNISKADFLTTSSFGNCNGMSAGLGGAAQVGVISVKGDIGFRVRSGPLGVTCERTISIPKMNSGWGVKLNFNETKNGSRCFASRDGKYYHVAVMKLVFSRGKTYAGWRSETVSTGLLAPGSVRRGAGRKTLTVLLTCKATPSNTSEVLSTISSVEFLTPEGAEGSLSWRDAFK